jgi:hypothetical protein
VSDEPPPDVEFVVGAGDSGVDEELAQPDRRTLSPPARMRLQIAAAVVALALVVVAIHIHSDDDGGSVARPAPSVVVPAPLPSVVVLPPAPPDPGLPQLDVFPVCPESGDGQPACETMRSVPDQFVAAVRAVLPQIETTVAVTENLRGATPQTIPGLWSRLFTGRAGTTTIRIVVQRGGDPVPVVLAPAHGGERVLIGRHRAQSYLVQVQVATPADHPLTQHDVDRLAQDARLIAA